MTDTELILLFLAAHALVAVAAWTYSKRPTT